MKNLYLLMLIYFQIAIVNSTYCQSDAKGTSDNQYFGRMANYYIAFDSGKSFDKFNFWNGKKYITVVGKCHEIHYSIKNDAKALIENEIIQNYAQIAKKKGGIEIFTGKMPDGTANEKGGLPTTSYKIPFDQDDYWVQVIAFNKGQDYELLIMQGKEYVAETTAKELLDSLNSQGRITLYINFDVNDVNIKTDSKPVIDKIVKMLTTDPTLKIQIEGHTDNQGNAAHNKQLSELRSITVMRAIVEQGIESDRITYIGYGQEKPIAKNETAEGRSKNRRVELVKK